MFRSLFGMADRFRDRGRRRIQDADKALGRWGEDVAHRHLQREGFTVVARNYRTATGSGEIDLVAWDGDVLVFVEVKTRATADFGPPERAIGSEKQRAIVRAAEDYIRRTDSDRDRVRFDVVTVVAARPPAVSHLRDVFSARTLAHTARAAP